MRWNGEVEGGLKPTKEYLGHLLAGCDLLSKDYCEKLKRIRLISVGKYCIALFKNKHYR
ncbi:hypothetical protein M1N67_01005 [Peptococcaceae bacterium]|nr:hypothetical protein [Peptococcaceae bacterium]